MKNQRFKSVDELEYVLKQQEDDWDDDSQSVPTQEYVAQSGDESEYDERHVMFEDGATEDPSTQESVASREASLESQGPGMTMEELTQHMLKVM
ncbi:hypothetical protein PHMEG_00012146 [Phytophthora megakarya]|uniref:Uncharacterized protein n=1 Tax=Phytophthora megakarya TaxID=4795 RepID=A0A225W9H3_9STRA|nr:hypothetical protein PHMEG_00012146 [Phytophthora megakarya]